MLRRKLGATAFAGAAWNRVFVMPGLISWTSRLCKRLQSTGLLRCWRRVAWDMEDQESGAESLEVVPARRRCKGLQILLYLYTYEPVRGQAAFDDSDRRPRRPRRASSMPRAGRHSELDREVGPTAWLVSMRSSAFFAYARGR